MSILFASSKMEYSLSITPLLVGGVTLFGLWLWYRNQKSKGLPPGPFSWPILGNIPQLALEGKKPVFQIALAWREKYGDVFLMRMGATRIVWVCGLKLGREVLIDRGEDFGYRPKWMTMARETQRGQGKVFLCLKDGDFSYSLPARIYIRFIRRI